MTSVFKTARRCFTPAVCLVAACAASHAPPVHFSQSAAFRAIDASIFAILEDDLNGDGMPDAVVARAVGPGWAPVVFLQQAGVEETTWSVACTGPIVEGSELGGLRWMSPGSGRLVMLIATTENPDEVTEHIALVDPLDGCAVRFEDRVHVTRPNGVVVAPQGLSGGVLLDDEDGSLRLVDRPSYLNLDAVEGELALLTQVRLRRIVGNRREVRVEERVVGLLVPLDVTVEWIADSAIAVERPELGDGDDATTFVVRAGEVGRLRIVAEAPIVGIEIRHGCFDAPPVALRLEGTNGKPHVIGERPVPGSFVRGTGRRRVTGAGVDSDLLLLGEARNEVSLAVGPGDVERCIRELEAFGFR
ncbi:MAG: hypothetical protein V3T05_12640 [Myxococcota bacterium]